MSSLFTNLNTGNNQGGAGGSGLFGNPNPPAGGSVFGTAPTAKPATGGLFGGLGGNTGAGNTGGGGLFSGLGTAGNAQAGGTTGAAGGSGGLFSGLGGNQTSQPATGASLFSGLGGANAQSQNQTSQPQQGRSLFGGSSLFAGGNSQAQQQNAQPAATSSLFGGASQSQQQQQQQQPNQQGASLFGGLGQSVQGQQQGGLGAPPGVPTAYFDSILESSKKRTHPDAMAEDLPQLQLGLGDLRQRIKRIGTGVNDRAADGRAHYLLAASGVDPSTAVKDLNSFTAAARMDRPQQAPEDADTDVETYLANLQTQTTLSMIQDGLARSVRDFDAFLEENVQLEWEAQRKRIYEHFGIRPKETVSNKSGFGASSALTESQAGGFGRSRRSKAAILAGSRATGPSDSVFGRSGLHKSVIGASGPIGTGHQPLFTDVEKKMEASGVSVAGPQDRFQREKQGRYAEKVQSLNVARMNKRPFAICREFAEVVEKSGEQHGQDLVKAYRALVEIVNEKIPEGQYQVEVKTKERAYAADYLDDSPNSIKNINVKKDILRGGARCLEKLFYEKLLSSLERNPTEAQRGGDPSVLPQISAYVRLLASKKNLFGDNSDLQKGDNGEYVWAILYFFIRSGHVHEADAYVKSNAIAFRGIDRNFGAYLHEYATSPDRRLTPDLQARISNEYNQRLRIAPTNTVDPYRMACYKIIGRCDLRTRSLADISQDVEDFAWVQLVLARELSRVDSMANEIYGLAEVQDTLREIGGRYFAKGGAEIGSSFSTYVFLQLSLGMFEEAVSYLYTYSYVDAVHLAIALDFYGLLRVSDPMAGGDELSSVSTKGLPQISFGSMIGLYTRDFRAANVSAAVDYLTLICLNKDIQGQGGNNQMTLCHEALRELVLESREFPLLLGDMSNDGHRIKGAIEERGKLIGLEEANEFMRTITMQAASIADDNGRVTDAVLLYHLAGEYDNVMVAINRAVSEAVAIPIGQEEMRIEPLKARSDRPDAHASLTSIDDPVELGLRFYNIYHGEPMFKSKVKEINLQSCATLLRMVEIKKEIAAQRWAQALDYIKTLEILPLNANGNSSTIRSYINKFSTLTQPVASNVPNLLMWAIMACNEQRGQLKNSQYGGNEGTKMEMIRGLRQSGMDLTGYTSQLRYRFPASLHEALARAQSE